MTSRPEPPLAALRDTIPFFPWIPLVPAALWIGTSIAALTLAIRANRRMAELEAALERDAAHERLHQQPLEPISP